MLSISGILCIETAFLLEMYLIPLFERRIEIEIDLWIQIPLSIDLISLF